VSKRSITGGNQGSIFSDRRVTEFLSMGKGDLETILRVKLIAAGTVIKMAGNLTPPKIEMEAMP